MFQLKFGKNINQELFKAEYLIKFSQFANFARAVIRSNGKTFFSKVSKILVNFNNVFNFENLLIYVLPKFN